MWASRELEQQALSEYTNPVSRTAVRASFHARRYMPLYALFTAWITIAVVAPSIDRHNNDNNSALTAAGGTNAGAAAGAQGTTAATDTGAVGTATGGGSAASGGAKAAKSGGATGAAAPASVGAGVTVRGVACKPGVPQIPYSHYSPPCVGKFSGNNGGATSRGVTATQILLAEQVNSDSTGPNATAIEQVNRQAGNPSNSELETIRDTYLAWFNKNFELYGRKVVIQKYNGQGNGTNQALGQDQAAACADADGIATSVKAFGAITFPGWTYDSIPFTECLAKYGLWAPLGGAYYPEKWYRQHDPYAYGIIPDCETVEHLIAEYIWKRLAQPGQKAQWAGDALLKQSARKFGIYIPNNSGYQDCAKLSNADLEAHGVKRASQYNYALDVSQFPQQAAQAMVQFKAAGVTTVELACDPISAIFLTQQADAQNYHPEWLLHGDALTDTDGYARLYSANQINGHLFGISQLGAQNIAGDPKGEAAQAWAEASGGKAMPNGAWQVYYSMLMAFDQLQAAGPNLTPQALGKATRALPELGGENLAQGIWQFGDTHTAIKTTQEVFWDSQATSSDGKGGDFIATFGGRWFRLGEFPIGNPDIKPR